MSTKTLSFINMQHKINFYFINFSHVQKIFLHYLIKLGGLKIKYYSKFNFRIVNKIFPKTSNFYNNIKEIMNI